jgi:hypothetical protein
MITPAMASTEEEEKDGSQLKLEEFEAELGEEGMQEVEDYLALQASLPYVVKAMPYSGLAFAATKPESQDVYMHYIDNFDVSEKEKERYKNKLHDVWDRYPFEITVYDYPFMLEIGPMIEEQAFSIYSQEELEAMRTVDMPDEPPELKTDIFRLQENEEYLTMEDSLPEVVINMPYGGLAFAAYDTEDQVEVIRYLDKSHISEEKKEEYKAKIQDIWNRYPDKITEDDYLFMNELGLITTSSARDEKEGHIVTEQATAYKREQNIPGFEGFMTTAILLCMYFGRKYK